MSNTANKIFLVVAWITIVFLYLYFLQGVYDNPQYKSFHLFFFLAIAGSLAYDGLKAILLYKPLHPSNATKISKLVWGYVASLAGSIAALFIGAELVVYGCVGNIMGQVIAGTGFIACIAAGTYMLTQAETYFKASNSS